mmetsp:Transcript_7860/g.13177  ORF Transcript_7860/g.13177 Transcript_7860/m.13177 type:complete len:275 (-) Transcript_7860:153-977(-)
MKTILNLAAVLLLATSANAVKLRALESAAISDCGCDDTCPIECCDDDNLPDHDCTNSGGCGVLPYFCDPTPPHLRESHESYPNQNRCPNRDDLYPTEYPACEVKDKENCCQNDLLDCLADQVSEDTSVIDVLLDFDWRCGRRGPVGPRGPKGPLGPEGPKGRTGPPGDRGCDGPPGCKGDIGSVGPPGFPGPGGDIGEEGEQGPCGPTGLTGPQGSQGKAGERGCLGPFGDQGQNGEQGRFGDRGRRGLEGDCVCECCDSGILGGGNYCNSCGG